LTAVIFKFFLRQIKA